MKTAIVASFIASAAAFAPVSQKTSSTSLKAFENEIGAQPPLGFYDPLGLLNDSDQERFDKLRYVELKHGRVCMLAFVGFLVPKAGIHLSGDIDFEGNAFASFPSGLGAVNGPDAISTPGLLQILAFIAFLEFRVMQDVTGQGEFLGDFRNGFDFGWDKKDAAWHTQKRTVELNQGRAAQMGILGLMVHEQLGGNLPIVGPM
ncbi:MAG: hypothetical protein SGILL_008490 [Bacillariaceae sp.]